MKRVAILFSCAVIAKTVAAAYPLPVWTNSIGMRFAYVPAGKLVTEARVTIRVEKPFSLGVTEVTQAQWRAVMGANPSNHKGRSLPVEMISWDDANEFCRRLTAKDGRTYRLPTEAEWEWACRALQNEFPEREIDKRAWTLANTTKTMPVGKRAPNPWGLFDMQGNVAEWCADIYSTLIREREHNALSKAVRIATAGLMLARALEWELHHRRAWRCVLPLSVFVSFARILSEQPEGSARGRL